MEANTDTAAPISKKSEQQTKPLAKQGKSSDSEGDSAQQKKTAAAIETASLQLKGGMFTLTVVELRQYSYETFSTELAQVVQQAPNFFQQTPVIISLEKLENPAQEIDFIDLIQVAEEFGLHPIAIRGGNEDHHVNALVAGLPSLPVPMSSRSAASKSNDTRPTPNDQLDALSDDTARYKTKVITTPVRSGQQIYVEGGDLIILSSVSTGAEILADGNIHVYGALRGRALAGVKGNKQARIFCQRLEAELISIAGHYKISEDLRGEFWQNGAHATLKGKQLVIEPLY